MKIQVCWRKQFDTDGEPQTVRFAERSMFTASSRAELTSAGWTREDVETWEEGIDPTWFAEYWQYGSKSEEPCGTWKDAADYLNYGEENGDLSSSAIITPDGTRYEKRRSGYEWPDVPWDLDRPDPKTSY